METLKRQAEELEILSKKIAEEEEVILGIQIQLDHAELRLRLRREEIRGQLAEEGEYTFQFVPQKLTNDKLRDAALHLQCDKDPAYRQLRKELEVHRASLVRNQTRVAAMLRIFQVRLAVLSRQSVTLNMEIPHE